MADRSYRSSGRDRYDRDRGYTRQEEQFEDASWRDDDERAHRQMGDAIDRDEYSQSLGQDRSYDRQRDLRAGQVAGYGYARPRYGTGETRGFGSFTGNDYGGRDFNAPRYGSSRTFDTSYGAGSQLAAAHGEWREPDYGYRGEYGRERNERGFLERAGDEVASWFGDDDAARRRRQDYRGHGPAGYTRSDDRILEDASDALTDDWGVDARNIQVTVTNAEVTLDGTVPSREQKRRAEDCVDDLSGVKNVQNNLRVQATDWEGSQANPTSSQA